MLRRKQIAGAVGAAVGFGFVLWALASTNLPERISQMFSAAPSPDVAAVTEPARGQSRKADDPVKAAEKARASEPLAIEIARVEAGGPSVLAGRSPPNHRVTVLANGREIATVVASDEGQWSAIIADGIAAGPLELKLTSQPKEGGQVVTSASRQLTVPEAPSAPKVAAASPTSQTSPTVTSTAPSPTKPPAAKSASAESGDKKALAEFEALVARTRKEMGAAPTPASPASAAEQSKSASGEGSTGSRILAAPGLAGASIPRDASVERSAKGQTAVAAAPGIAAPATDAVPVRTAAAVPAPIPVPITFTTDDIELTPDGARAAALLAEYLRLKRPEGISLSGHADSRGPDGYNMELSRKRLEAIETYLRSAGYTGKLSLLPRGKREPYSGIDRTRLPREEVYQADRRVELQLTP
jgi:outer membrane protein OmpA-like peptidoglycan-associated protein